MTLELTNIKKGICWYCSIFKILRSGEEYIAENLTSMIKIYLSSLSLAAIAG
jgi:hypothetical protein